MDNYQEYIYKSRYARYLPDENRREEWPETVDRYINFFRFKIKNESLPWDELRMAISTMEVMPSMRALMTAGPALERDNVAGYNCAYMAIDNVRAFDELMYILMCGTGVGFSVERQYITKLPEISDDFRDSDTVVKVGDSKIGWARAYRSILSLLYSGEIPKWDVSAVRPRGARLNIFGGRASGPEPLAELFVFTIQTFKGAAGRKLTSLEVHDLVCKIADVVVCGGVRRSALLSLSNLTDQRMRNAKSGDWYSLEPQRALANNSVCYTEKPDMGIFMEEWASLYRSKSGERGIFNREACVNMAPDRRDTDHEFGTNPCSEIVLRSKQFCNLTEVIIRPEDSWDDIKRKIRYATILGTIQSTLTDFRYISSGWKKNTEEERLLGVSLTGIMDNKLCYDLHPVVHSTSLFEYSEYPLYKKLKELREYAVTINKETSALLGINPSAAITCVKPSGTVSQLCNTSSGIHPRYSEYYIRRVRADATDPLGKHLKSLGMESEHSRNNPNEIIFSFPISSPRASVCSETIRAVEQLELWKVYAEAWCEHKPSVSIYVREHEWLEVAAWIYKNWDIVNGISFFPMDDHIYQQAPYEKITETQYEEHLGKIPRTLSFSFEETEDSTTGSQELACTGGACEL